MRLEAKDGMKLDIDILARRRKEPAKVSQCLLPALRLS
jgi:hypothetical protein